MPPNDDGAVERRPFARWTRPLKAREFSSMAADYAQDAERARTAELQRQAVRKVRRARWKRKREAAAENASE
jgi:hypothetical protein